MSRQGQGQVAMKPGKVKQEGGGKKLGKRSKKKVDVE